MLFCSKFNVRIVSAIVWGQVGVFSGLCDTTGWQVEDAAARLKLPEYRVIPAAEPHELTPSLGAQREGDDRNWPVSHGDMGLRRYSGLKQINRSNVADLEVSWIYHSNDGEGNRQGEGSRRGWRGIQTNPVIVDGIMYAPTAGRAIVALDARNGKELWRFQLEAVESPGLSDAPARRGLVFWNGANRWQPRIVFTCGEWLYALYAESGLPVKNFGEEGRVPLPTSGTPTGGIWRDNYIVPGHKGDVYSFSLIDGSLNWRFHTIPTGEEFGADTWKGADKKGANPWAGLALDVERGIAYVSVGAPHPNFYGSQRVGDNLYGNCVVALDAATGERLWHFQNVRHDTWDLDNPAPPNLVTIRREGRLIDAVACVTKTGTTLLLDRVSGKPIFPFRLRRAPTSTLPGEVTAPYQPDPILPEPFAKTVFTRDDITNISPEATAFIETELAGANYGTWYSPHEAGKRTVSFGVLGGAEWPGGSFDAETGRLYFAANHLAFKMTILHNDEPPPAVPATAGELTYQQFCMPCHGPDRQGVGMAPALQGLRHSLDDAAVKEILRQGRNTMPPMPLSEEQTQALLDFLMIRDRGPDASSQKPDAPSYAVSGWGRLLDQEGYPGNRPPWGTLNSLNLNTGKLEWSVPLGEYDQLKERGIPKTGTINIAGPMVTAGGVVFCAGTADEKIRAFDKDTGEELWSAKLPFGGYAPPASYEIDGKQYIVIAAAGGGMVRTKVGDAWVAFALPEAN